MWELAYYIKEQIGFIEKALSEGFEPFAVHTDKLGNTYIWFKRKIIQGETRRVQEVEVRSKRPRAKKGTDTRDTGPTEG